MQTSKLLRLFLSSNVLRDWFRDYRNHREMAGEKVNNALEVVSADVKRSENKLNVHLLEM